MDSLLIHTHSTEFSGRVPGLPGVGLKRKDTLDFGLDLFLYGKGDEKVEKAKERFLAYLDSTGYPVEKGFPVPSVVFSCVTFPLRWSAEDKITAVFYAIDELSARERGGDIESAKEKMQDFVGSISPAAPNPWGAFYLWCDMSGDPQDPEKINVVSGFADKNTLNRHFDSLWDVDDVRNDPFWTDFSFACGREFRLMRSHCYADDGNMWGVMAEVFS